MVSDSGEQTPPPLPPEIAPMTQEQRAMREQLAAAYQKEIDRIEALFKSSSQEYAVIMGLLNTDDQDTADLLVWGLLPVLSEFHGAHSIRGPHEINESAKFAVHWLEEDGRLYPLVTWVQQEREHDIFEFSELKVTGDLPDFSITPDQVYVLETCADRKVY